MKIPKEGTIKVMAINEHAHINEDGSIDVRLLNKKQSITLPRSPMMKCPNCGAETIPTLMGVYELKGQSCMIGAYCTECDIASQISTNNYTDPNAEWTVKKADGRPRCYFRDIIIEISERFCSIYNEAQYAEILDLNDICGVGYRKALEFLIKDYCIYLHPDRKMAIIRDDLGKCIAENIDNPTIKEVASRAAWLGNDESHYEKRWTEKNFRDLDHIITLLCDAIEQDEKIKKLLAEMPEQKKK